MLRRSDNIHSGRHNVPSFRENRDSGTIASVADLPDGPQRFDDEGRAPILGCPVLVQRDNDDAGGLAIA